MNLSGLIMETSTFHSTKSARPLSIVKFVFLCDNDYFALFKSQQHDPSTERFPPLPSSVTLGRSTVELCDS